MECMINLRITLKIKLISKKLKRMILVKLKKILISQKNILKIYQIRQREKMMTQKKNLKIKTLTMISKINKIIKIWLKIN